MNQAVASFSNHNFLVFVLLLYGIMLNWNFNAAYNSYWKTMWQKVEFNLSRLKTFHTHTITLCMFLVCGNILPRWKSVEKINQKLYQYACVCVLQVTNLICTTLPLDFAKKVASVSSVLSLSMSLSGCVFVEVFP